MLRPEPIRVHPLKEHHLCVRFDNGETRNFDVSPLIKGNWYGKLKDAEMFQKVSIKNGVVCWPDGQDVCPEDLYDLSIPM